MEPVKKEKKDRSQEAPNSMVPIGPWHWMNQLNETLATPLLSSPVLAPAKTINGRHLTERQDPARKGMKKGQVEHRRVDSHGKKMVQGSSPP